MTKRMYEVLFLTLLMCGSIVSTCWGPPGPPPSTPIAAPEPLAVTALLIAGYGLWKKNK